MLLHEVGPRPGLLLSFALPSHVLLLTSWAKMAARGVHIPLRKVKERPLSQAWGFCPGIQLELSHMATSSCKALWEMASFQFPGTQPQTGSCLSVCLPHPLRCTRDPERGRQQAGAWPHGTICSLGWQLPLPPVRPALGLPGELKTGSQQRPAEGNTTAGVSVGLQASFPPALSASSALSAPSRP